MVRLRPGSGQRIELRSPDGQTHRETSATAARTGRRIEPGSPETRSKCGTGLRGRPDDSLTADWIPDQTATMRSPVASCPCLTSQSAQVSAIAPGLHPIALRLPLPRTPRPTVRHPTVGGVRSCPSPNSHTPTTTLTRSPDAGAGLHLHSFNTSCTHHSERTEFRMRDTTETTTTRGRYVGPSAARIADLLPPTSRRRRHRCPLHVGGLEAREGHQTAESLDRRVDLVGIRTASGFGPTCC